MHYEANVLGTKNTKGLRNIQFLLKDDETRLQKGD